MTSFCSYSYSIIPIIVLSLLLSRPQLSTPRPLPESDHRRHLAAAQPNATWLHFSRLLDAERGAHLPAVADLKRYLHRFGYLPSPGNFTDLFDERLEFALSLYQSKLGLPVTGKLDSATISQLATPRCGVRDAPPATVGPHGSPPARFPGVKHFAFFNGRPSWDRPRPFTLTYAFSPEHFIDYLDRGDVKAAFTRAFSRWAAVIPVRFEETSDYSSADVRIGFYAGDHGDGEPFDGMLGILAHAFSPESGRLHMDMAETWALDLGKETSTVAVDLESVATHEIGHILGLGHTRVKEAVMYPSLSPRTKKVNLRLDDVEGAQALYGSNPDFRFSSLIQSDISAANPFLRNGPRSWWLEIIAVVATRGVTLLFVL